MHESSNPNVKFHIDTVTETAVENKLQVTGWIFHDTHRITHLGFLNDKINFYQVHKSRSDVKGVYPHLPSDRVGFDMTIDKESLYSPVEIFLEETNSVKINPLLNDSISISKTENNSLDSDLPTGDFKFGNYKKNLIVVDNFYEDPDGIREFAMKNLTYEETDYHKGARSKEQFIIDGTRERLEKLIGKKIKNWDHSGSANGKFQFCKATDPLVYHVDLQNYAGIVFLTPDAPLEAGTATYKSKFTGVRGFDQPVKDNDLYFKTFAGRSNEMNFYDGTAFELVDRVGNVYNRLVLFDSTALHAATQYFGDSIENARFFQLFFFDVDFNADIT